jgi:drug/metabolite transporter (DMT)-like permease
VAALGALFFCVFFVIYNVAMSYTSAARGSLALSMLPLTTMLVAALLGRASAVERRALVMAAATLCMALYNVWSRPLMAHSSMLGFLATGMGAGALHATAARFAAPQWWAVACLGVFGGAAAFYLWVFALERTTPTRVAAVLIGEPFGLNVVGGIASVNRTQASR